MGLTRLQKAERTYNAAKSQFHAAERTLDIRKNDPSYTDEEIKTAEINLGSSRYGYLQAKRTYNWERSKAYMDSLPEPVIVKAGSQGQRVDSGRWVTFLKDQKGIAFISRHANHGIFTVEIAGDVETKYRIDYSALDFIESEYRKAPVEETELDRKANETMKVIREMLEALKTDASISLDETVGSQIASMLTKAQDETHKMVQEIRKAQR